MKNRKPWERGYIPKPGKKPALVERAEVPEGWEEWTASGKPQLFVRPAGRWSIAAEMIQTRSGFALYLLANGGTPRSGVFRAPEMIHRSPKFLAAWAEIELANMPDRPALARAGMFAFSSDNMAIWKKVLTNATAGMEVSFTAHDEITVSPIHGELGQLEGVRFHES